MRNSLVLSIIIILFSCAEKEPKIEAKSEVILYQEEVILVHDTAMATMDIIMKTRSQLKKMKPQIEDSLQLQSIDSAIYMLAASDKAMMDWMRQFILQTDTASVEKAMPYLESEMVKIKNVSTKMNNSITFGKAILNEK